MFIQKLYPWHTHPPQGGNPLGHSHSTSRGSDAPCLRRPLLHQLHGVQLRPVHLRPGKSPARTLDADRLLYGLQPWAGIHKKPHQAKVAVGKGVTRPHPDYKAPHGLFGRLVQLDQLLQLVAHGHRVFGPSILRLEQTSPLSFPPRPGNISRHPTSCGANLRMLLESSGLG